jgi:signal transduction histidine kinase/CheY-like chemotaxis protein
LRKIVFLDSLKKKLTGNPAVFLFSVAALLVLIISVYTGILVNSFSVYLRKSIEERLLATSKAAAAIISIEEFRKLTSAEDMEKPLYADLKRRLVNFAKEYGVLFVYYYYLTEDGMLQPVIDNDYTEDSYSLLYPPLPIEEAPQKALDLGAAVITGLGSYSFGFVGLISSFAPVFDANGNIVALAGVDIADEDMLKTRNRTIILSILLFFSIVFVITSGYLSLVFYGKKEAILSRRFKQQGLMADLSKSLISALDIKDVINNVLGITGEFMGVSRMIIGFTKTGSAVSHEAYVWYASNETAAVPVQERLNTIINNFPKVQPADGIIPAVYCNDAREDEQYAAMYLAGVKSFIMAPLYIDGKFWAVLSIEECTGPRKWSDSERYLISALGSIIAGAVIRAQREHERNIALDQARKASQAKSDFLANMSHEMRTPMNAIIGMTAIAKTVKDPEKKEYCLGKIEDASTHLLGVINDILDMSKIEANKFELSFDDFNFEKVLRKVVNVINFRVEEKCQNLSVHIDKNIPTNLYGDDQRLAQVITNLLSNAVKFTPEEGKIRLDARFEKEENGICCIRISVTDSGIGISPEQQARLFSSFQQADSSTSRKFGGTGLGLVISRQIVEMMNGTFHLESEPGKGSSFSFTVKIERGRHRPGDLPVPLLSWDKLRILAVDDAEDIRQYFKDLSEQIGFFCDTAAAGTEALELIAQNGPYDMYFVDWKMPGMNGIELTRRIKEDQQSPSVVIMISASDWITIEEDAKLAGVDKFMSKPLFPSVIVDCITECTGGGKQAVPDASAISGENFAGFRILLAEDVEINREIVLTILEPTSIDIDCAENGAAALKMYTGNPDKYDIIFMDIQMPEMDGYEVTRKIREWEQERQGNLSRPIPIIAMTANVFREDIEKCLSAGMDDHLGKPLDFSEVMDKLRKYLSRQGSAS